MRSALLLVLLTMFAILCSIPGARATPISVTADISFLNGSAFQLELDLFNKNGTLGDSYVLIDNVYIAVGGVILNPGLIDFEDDSLGGFDDSLNKGVAVNTTGAFPGDPGTHQLRINEANYFPVIIFRNFPGSSATQLHFDFELLTPFGSSDSFVASLLDPDTLDPQIAQGVLGPGDAAILDATGSGYSTAPGVNAVPIPEPSTILLLTAGLGGILAYGRTRFGGRKAKGA